MSEPPPVDLSRVIAHLSGQFERGLPFLFTGAGFSLGSLNRSGKAPPLPGDLKEELWRLSYPGEAFEDSSSLPDLFHTALLRRKTDLEALFEELYTIAPDSLADWYEPFFALPTSRAI